MKISLLQLPEVSYKPFKYWRPFCKIDEPYTTDKEIWIWHNDNKGNSFWTKEHLGHIRCNDYNPILLESRIKKYHDCLRKGKLGECIVEVKPKYNIGKYSNDIEILRIFSEDVVFEISNESEYLPRKEYIKETIYYIKINNKVHFVKESSMTDIMENKTPATIEVGYRSAEKLEHWTTKVCINIAFNANKAEKGPQEILDFLNNPDRENTLDPFGFNIKPDNKKWEIYRRKELTSSEYNNFYNKPKDKYDYVSNDHSKGKEHILYVPYHSIDINKIDSLKKKSYDNPINNYKNKKKVSTGIKRRRQLRNRSKKRAEYAKTRSELGALLNADPWLYVTTSINEKPTKIRESQLEDYQKKLGDNYTGMITMSKQEYIKLYSSKFPTEKKEVVPTEPKYSTPHPDGVRKKRRNNKQPKFTDIGGMHVKINKQIIPLPIKNDIKDAKSTKETPGTYITRNTISHSKVNLAKKGQKSFITDNEATKIVYHIDRKKPILITRHNLAKQKDRTIKDSVKNLIKYYRPSDRRVTPTSENEVWSKTFFIILEMLKSKERHSKIIKEITNSGFTEEWAKGFLKYLLLRRTNGSYVSKNASKVKTPHNNYYFKHTTITKPHIEINYPKPYSDVVIIKHELPDKNTGKLETLITPNTYMNHQHKFFKIDEDKKPVLINGGIYVHHWMLQEEYDSLTKELSPDDLKVFDKSSDKWNKTTIASTKEVKHFEKIVEKLPKKEKGSTKKWKTPMLSLEESAKKRIEKMKNMKLKDLFSFIDTVVIPSMHKKSKVYEAMINELYQHDKEYRDRLYKVLSKYANKRLDWIGLAEQITIPFK